ncbi:YiiD C-terminal domain-containing protein [Stenotrophomonas sp. SY1]|jgi:thioesterase domain-containing protein|uniref:YiiD C-terminal domain-containing protein n=1 Tax=Stenotrophomonas sp. SY1 TaxID=477235 RepID=UPI001E4E4EC6|nr:YiiD C-terminal domain-containing protein [Stenotrophomonas sp. SY1]MCD9088579.1 YiiD C-terminal domain-containing protein [Stenotrophomonas sp. SY1]
MSEHPPSCALLEQLQTTLSAMPPVAAMDIRITGYENGVLRMQAPLAANINDKGNAFGGSLASVMTLAGWALVSLQLSQAGHEAEVYVADSSIRYRAPVYGDLLATARAAPDQDWAAFLALFGKRGRARVTVRAQIEGGAAELEGRFVAINKA